MNNHEELGAAILAAYRDDARRRWAEIAARLGQLQVGTHVRVVRLPRPGPGPGKAYLGRSGVIVARLPARLPPAACTGAVFAVCLVDFGPGDGPDGRDVWGFGDSDLLATV